MKAHITEEGEGGNWDKHKQHENNMVPVEIGHCENVWAGGYYTEHDTEKK